MRIQQGLGVSGGTVFLAEEIAHQQCKERRESWGGLGSLVIVKETIVTGFPGASGWWATRVGGETGVRLCLDRRPQ